jgi:hypothetical protein
MISTLVQVGGQGSIVWLFAAGVLAVYLVAAVVVMGVTAIKRFLDA